MRNNLSVHLQNFPDVSFLNTEKELVKNMDMVRAICSSTLFIRDQRNLRVRLPLSRLIIVGKNIKNIAEFSDIISEEINVKKIEFNENVDEIAELKLQINFKKIGSKYGAKVKEITNAVKNGAWQKISQNQIRIALDQENIDLIDDEFELKLTQKENPDSTMAIAVLPSNDCLVMLDTTITEELKQEGIARDIVRAIQQNRKDANLDISDRINLRIFSANAEIVTVIRNFADYIREQTLGKTLETTDETGVKNSKFSFANKIDDGDLTISFDVSNS